MNVKHFGNSGVKYEIDCNPPVYDEGTNNLVVCQPTPVICNVALEKKETINGLLLIPDKENNQMLLAKIKSSNVMDGWNDTRRVFGSRELQIVTKGVFEVLCVEKSILNSGAEVDKNVVFNIITARGENKTERIPFDPHLSKAQFKNFMEENGVVVRSEFLTAIHDIVMAKIAMAEVKCVNVGFSAQLKSSATTAPKGSEIISALDISEKSPAIVTHRVIPLVIACAVSVLSMFPDDGISLPPIVFINEDYSHMKKAVEKLYRTTMNVDLKTASIITEKVTLIGVETMSTYKKNVLIDSIEERLCSTLSLPMIIAKNTEFLKDKTGAIILRFPTYESDFPDFLSFFHRFILIDENRNKTLKAYAETHENATGCDYLTHSQAKFVAVILAVFEVFLKALEFDCEFIEECLDELESILDKSIDVTSAINYKDAVVEFLEGGHFPVSSTFSKAEEPTIFLYKGCAWLSREILCSCAEELGLKTAPLVEYLKEIGALRLSNDGQRQINRHYPDGASERFYVLRMSKLYNFGELHLLPDKFEDEEPAVAIPIGLSDGVGISLYVDKMDCNGNNHTSVMGLSGSGKSYFLAQLAKGAANCGICSCFISAEELSHKELEEMSICKRYVINDDGSVSISARKTAYGFNNFISSIEVADGDPKKLEDVLEKIYVYAKKKRTPFFLFVDEIQLFNLGDGSALFNKILRTGRKYGIMLVLSTQFVDSSMTASASAKFKQAKNYFEFKTSDAKKSLARLDVNSEEREEAANVLKELSVGICVAKGNLMTPYCKVDYPIEMKITRVEPVFNEKASPLLIEDDIIPIIKFD